MKVAIISGSFPPIRCGVGDYSKMLVDELPPEVDYSVITSHDVPSADRVVPVVKYWGWRSLGVILGAVRQQQPDIIHMQYHSVRYGRRLFANFLLWVLRFRFPSSKLIVTVHEYHDASLLGKIRVLITCLPAHAVIATNTETIEALPWFIRSKASRIPIGSNAPIVTVSADERRKANEKYRQGAKTVITYYGFIDPSKGVTQLVDAMKQLPPALRLLIATAYNPSDPYHQGLKQTVDQDDRIDWLGYMETEEISRILQITDIAVLPFQHPASLRRGSLLTTLDHGVPTITTGPVKNPLSHGENVYATNDNDADTIALAVSRLMDDLKLRKLLGVNATKLAVDFNWKNIAASHVTIYAQLAKNTHQKS